MRTAQYVTHSLTHSLIESGFWIWNTQRLDKPARLTIKVLWFMFLIVRRVPWPTESGCEKCNGLKKYLLWSPKDNPTVQAQSEDRTNVTLQIVGGCTSCSWRAYFGYHRKVSIFFRKTITIELNGMVGGRDAKSVNISMNTLFGLQN